jgi:hypothetical protein
MVLQAASIGGRPFRLHGECHLRPLRAHRDFLAALYYPGMARTLGANWLRHRRHRIMDGWRIALILKPNGLPRLRPKHYLGEPTEVENAGSLLSNGAMQH